MKIVYIAHKVGDDVKGNIEKIISIVRNINITEPDTVPFAPYIPDVMALNDKIPYERERGLRNNKHYFQKGIIDELRLYGPKVSAGMIEEIKMARLYGIPIVNKLTENKDLANSLLEEKPDYFKCILNSVLSTFEIAEWELKSKSRKRNIAMARQVFIGLSYEFIPFVTSVKLGEFLNRDHSTIVYSRQLCEDLLERDEVFSSHYNRVKIIIQNTHGA